MYVCAGSTADDWPDLHRPAGHACRQVRHPVWPNPNHSQQQSSSNTSTLANLHTYSAAHTPPAVLLLPGPTRRLSVAAVQPSRPHTTCQPSWPQQHTAPHTCVPWSSQPTTSVTPSVQPSPSWQVRGCISRQAARWQGCAMEGGQLRWRLCLLRGSHTVHDTQRQHRS